MSDARVIEDEFPPVPECGCGLCKSACQWVPGWFLPSEIAPLAAALGLSVSELFKKHLAINWWAPESSGIPLTFVLAPAIKQGLPGREYPGDPRGRCRWYRDGRCAVHEKGKPFECARSHHDLTGEQIHALHRAMALAWAAPEHQQMIRELLGREPQEKQLPRSAVPR